MSHAQFKCTQDEYRLIDEIVDRAIRAGVKSSDSLNLKMDLAAAHSNGCPLDFAKLLAFDDANFGHDVFGVRRHIDRQTGVLMRNFLPRCAKPAPTTNG